MVFELQRMKERNQLLMAFEKPEGVFVLCVRILEVGFQSLHCPSPYDHSSFQLLLSSSASLLTPSFSSSCSFLPFFFFKKNEIEELCDRDARICRSQQ